MLRRLFKGSSSQSSQEKQAKEKEKSQVQYSSLSGSTVVRMAI